MSNIYKAAIIISGIIAFLIAVFGGYRLWIIIGEVWKFEEERKTPEAKVLVVDDENIVREVLRRYLEYWNLDVETAGDGFEALKKIEIDSYDLILADLMMPGMDGLALTDEIIKKQPDAIIILMTGYASVDTAVEAFKRGIFEYVI